MPFNILYGVMQAKFYSMTKNTSFLKNSVYIGETSLHLNLVWRHLCKFNFVAVHER